MKAPPAQVRLFSTPTSILLLGPSSAFGMQDLKPVSVLSTYEMGPNDRHAFGVLQNLRTDSFEMSKAQDYLGKTQGHTYSISATEFSRDSIAGLHSHLRSGQSQLIVVDRYHRHATSFSTYAKSGQGHVPLAHSHQAAGSTSATPNVPVPHTVSTAQAVPPPANVGNWPVEQRLKLLFEDMLPLLGQDLRAYVKSMLTGKALAELVAGVLVMAGLQAIPVVGEIADAALLGLAYAYAGWDGLRAIPILIKAVRHAASATTKGEIEAAAPDAARALETLGGDVLAVLILRAAKRNTSGGALTEDASTSSKPVVDRNRGSGIRRSLKPKVLDTATMERIKAIPKGDRPDPATYMSRDMIDSQLAPFQANGASRFMTSDNLARYGPAQRDGTSFVMPSNEADQLLQSSGGDKTALANALGINPEQLNGSDLVRVDFQDPNSLGLRIPSGNEAGANDQWIPGGRLPDGSLEAVIDPKGSASYTTTIIGR